MKIFMTGGTGFVGTILVRKLTQKNHTVTILTRKIRKGHDLPEGASFFEGNSTEPGPWQQRAAEHDACINLAGLSLMERWSKKRKRKYEAVVF